MCKCFTWRNLTFALENWDSLTDTFPTEKHVIQWTEAMFTFSLPKGKVLLIESSMRISMWYFCWITAKDAVLSFFIFYCCDKICWPKQVREESVYGGLQFHRARKGCRGMSIVSSTSAGVGFPEQHLLCWDSVWLDFIHVLCIQWQLRLVLVYMCIYFGVLFIYLSIYTI